MKFFMKSIRNGSVTHSVYEGMDADIVERLMTDLGHTQIEFIAEDEYRTANNSQNP